MLPRTDHRVQTIQTLWSTCVSAWPSPCLSSWGPAWTMEEGLGKPHLPEVLVSEGSGINSTRCVKTWAFRESSQVAWPTQPTPCYLEERRAVVCTWRLQWLHHSRWRLRCAWLFEDWANANTAEPTALDCFFREFYNHLKSVFCIL